MPSWATVSNPVDIEPLTEIMSPAEAYGIALEAALSDENVDLCLLIMGTMRMPKVSADFIENVKRAIEAGAGISLLPRPTVAREVALGTLKAIPLEGVHWERPLGIVHRRHKQFSLAAKRFVEMLQLEFAPDQGTKADSASSQEALQAS